MTGPDFRQGVFANGWLYLANWNGLRAWHS